MIKPSPRGQFATGCRHHGLLHPLEQMMPSAQSRLNFFANSFSFGNSPTSFEQPEIRQVALCVQPECPQQPDCVPPVHRKVDKSPNAIELLGKRTLTKIVVPRRGLEG